MFDYTANMNMGEKKKENLKYCQEFFVVHMHIRKTGTGQEGQHPHNSHCFCRHHGAAGGNQKHSGSFGAPLLLSTRSPVAGGQRLYFKHAPRCRAEPREGARGLLAPTARPSFSPRTSAWQQPLRGTCPQQGPTGDGSRFPDPCSPSGSEAGWFASGLRS